MLRIDYPSSYSSYSLIKEYRSKSLSEKLLIKFFSFLLPIDSERLFLFLTVSSILFIDRSNSIRSTKKDCFRKDSFYRSSTLRWVSVASQISEIRRFFYSLIHCYSKVKSRPHYLQIVDMKSKEPATSMIKPSDGLIWRTVPSFAYREATRGKDHSIDFAWLISSQNKLSNGQGCWAVRNRLSSMTSFDLFWPCFTCLISASFKMIVKAKREDLSSNIRSFPRDLLEIEWRNSKLVESEETRRINGFYVDRRRRQFSTTNQQRFSLPTIWSTVAETEILVDTEVSSIQWPNTEWWLPFENHVQQYDPKVKEKIFPEKHLVCSFYASLIVETNHFPPININVQWYLKQNKAFFLRKIVEANWLDSLWTCFDDESSPENSKGRRREWSFVFKRIAFNLQ